MLCLKLFLPYKTWISNIKTTCSASSKFIMYQVNKQSQKSKLELFEFNGCFETCVIFPKV